MNAQVLLNVVVCAACFVCSLVCFPFKQYQLAYYRAVEFFAGLKRRWKSLVPPLSCTATSAVVVALCPESYVTFAAVACACLTAASVAAGRIGQNKSELVPTARFIRFFATFTVFAAATSAAAYFFPIVAAFPLVACSAAGAAAHIVVTPIEKARNARYVETARRRLDEINPITIGITGSYGKTTLKNVLAALLSEKYRVCATPSSFNTPLGIARTIRENATDETEIFIAEMGARRSGDIDELTRLVRPTYAVITAVGSQHLATFGSLKAIKEEKYRLARSLERPENAFFGEGATELYRRHGKGEAVGETIFCEDVETTNGATSFTVVRGFVRLRLTTKMSGDFVPYAITLAAAVALRLGVDGESIKKAVLGLNSVAHRQELLYNGSDVIVDDAYNANEQGAKSALRLLSGFSGRTRVLVTPGIVELGVREYDANYELGEYAAGRCDYAIFVGGNARALVSGAESGGMRKDRIIEVGSLAAATEALKKIKGARAILFENDLPDDY